MLADLGTIALVIGFFLLVYGSVKYGTDILRGTVGEEAIVAAVACQGLTGATLAACQKAQPKPTGITAARPKGITAARPPGITAARPKRPLSMGTGGGVGGPSTSAFDCKQAGGTRQCITSMLNGRRQMRCRCLKPITAPSRNVLAYNNCIKRAEQYGATKQKLAMDSLAAQYGYTGLNPGKQLTDNAVQLAQNQSAWYRVMIIRNRYTNLTTDLIHQCEKRFLGLDIIGDQNRGQVPRSAMDPSAGGVANPRAEKPLPPGVYPT